jgi:hypothetical protein
MVVLRGTQAVGLGPHSSHLIYIYKSKSLNICTLSTAGFTIVLKHSSSLARERGGGAHLPAKNIFTMDLCLQVYGAILNLKAFYFGAIPDIMIELIA